MNPDTKAEIKKAFAGKDDDGIERIELVRGNFQPGHYNKEEKKWEDSKLLETGYPKPVKRHLLVYENFGLSIEESYFWIRDFLAEQGFPVVDKILDTFTASEQSSFFGASQQKLSIQQDRISSYLATIGKMVKEMFQVVREIKLLEEREQLYILAAGNEEKGIKPDDGAEKTLKGTWIDFIDNGPQGVKASSIYGLASQLGYGSLPDLFFAAPPNMKQKDVSAHVDKLKDSFNERVRAILVRKLELYVAWRDSTAREITSKKKFTISYLRQHYNSIKLYIDWVKPYLKNVRRMGMDQEQQTSPDIVGAFEGAVVEIEILAKEPAKSNDEPRACILATFVFRTRPIMNTGQDYQRGPIHLGRMEMTLRGYAWSEDEVAKYKNIRMLEDFAIMRTIDDSLSESFKSLGEDILKYLKESKETFAEEDPVERLAKSLLETKAAISEQDAREKAKKILEKESNKKKDSIFEPFMSIGSGAKELAKGLTGQSDSSKAEARKEKNKEARKKAAKSAAFKTTLTYTLYKKSHRLVTP